HRIMTGKSTRPYKSSLKPIADYFSLNIEQLTGDEPIEGTALKEKEQRNQTLAKITYIPLLPWESLSLNPQSDKNLYENIPFIGKISDNGYATIIQDSSMEPV